MTILIKLRCVEIFASDFQTEQGSIGPQWRGEEKINRKGQIEQETLLSLSNQPIKTLSPELEQGGEKCFHVSKPCKQVASEYLKPQAVRC